MSKINLFEDLKNNSYPGRGIVIGTSPDGKSAVTAEAKTAVTAFLPRTAMVYAHRRLTRANSKTRTLSYMRRFVFSETRRLLQTATRPTRYMTLWTNK